MQPGYVGSLRGKHTPPPMLGLLYGGVISLAFWAAIASLFFH